MGRIRSCDGCTKCCEGYLSATILGHRMDFGKPCFFKGNGCCSIYKTRPVNPCVNFKCEWLQDTSIPRKFKPDVSNIILVKRTVGGELCVEMVQATEEPISQKNINWFHKQYYTGKFLNIYYKPDVKHNPNKIVIKGSDIFVRGLLGDQNITKDYCHEITLMP